MRISKYSLAIMMVSIFIALWPVLVVECFVPSVIIDSLITTIDKKTMLDLGQVSDSYSHDTILRRGVIRSVARYFYDQPNGKKKINLKNLGAYEKDIYKLYEDYYGRNIAIIQLDLLLKVEMEPNVASVDLDSDTKDLPYAHFDAEKMPESNQRVIDFKSDIDKALKKKDYSSARKLSSQILHTIQDFYSHSNWVEMGQKTILATIGTSSFKSQPVVKPSDPNLCKANCKLVTTKCPAALTAISKILQKLKPDMTLTCPLQYYQCGNNIVMLKKLLSGYYTNQKLQDGTVVENPGTLMKCNHGGALDSNSYNRQAVGGINKDSGVYLISPHANLHLKAVDLAVQHTEYFFNAIRAQIGDSAFNDFLKIDNKI